MPLFWLSLAFLCGVLLGERLATPWWAWLALAAVAPVWLLSSTFVRRRGWQTRLPFWRLPSLSIPYSILLFALALGAARYAIELPAPSSQALFLYNDQPQAFILEGEIVAPVDRRDGYDLLVVDASRLHAKDEDIFQPVEGRLLVRTPPGGGWQFGDRVRLEGSLVTPAEMEGFSYREYLARRGIYSQMPDGRALRLGHGTGNRILAGIYHLREAGLRSAARIFPEPESALISGIVLGVESGIPAQVEEAFIATGTSHIIAISGFNITILAGLFSLIFQRSFGRRWGALAAGLGIAGYTLLVGAEAAVVRAAIMGGLTLFARLVGRRQDGLNSLAFVAALMALQNPVVLWDIGFQLSFAATLGLVLYAEPLSQAFISFASRWLPLSAARNLAQPVGEYLLFTLAAQATTLPVILYHFQRLSLSSLLANPLILPAQPAVMVLGGLAVLLGMISFPLGQVMAFAAYPFIAFTIRVVEWLAQMPLGNFATASLPLVAVLAYYGLLLGWTFAPDHLRQWLHSKLPIGSRRPALVASLLGIGAVLAWSAAFRTPDGLLHLTVLAVSGEGRSGEGLLIQTPDGRYLLVNGGPSATRLADGLGRRLPLFHRRIDWLVVAGIGDDQLASLPTALERYPAEQALWAGAPLGSRSARNLQAALAQTQTPIHLAQSGQRFDLGHGAGLRVLATSRRGAVLLLEWQNFRALLPLGVDFENLEQLQTDNSPRELSALLLADAGYAPSNPPAWIEKLHPQVVLLSVAADDRDGLPSSETLAAVQGYSLLRSDRNGWIELSTDGDQMWVEVEIE